MDFEKNTVRLEHLYHLEKNQAITGQLLLKVVEKKEILKIYNETKGTTTILLPLTIKDYYGTKNELSILQNHPGFGQIEQNGVYYFEGLSTGTHPAMKPFYLQSKSGMKIRKAPIEISIKFSHLTRFDKVFCGEVLGADNFFIFDSCPFCQRKVMKTTAPLLKCSFKYCAKPITQGDLKSNFSCKLDLETKNGIVNLSVFKSKLPIAIDKTDEELVEVDVNQKMSGKFFKISCTIKKENFNEETFAEVFEEIDEPKDDQKEENDDD